MAKRYRYLTSAAGPGFSAKAGDVVDAGDLPGEPDALVAAGWVVEVGARETGTAVPRAERAARRTKKRKAARKA